MKEVLVIVYLVVMALLFTVGMILGVIGADEKRSEESQRTLKQWALVLIIASLFMIVIATMWPNNSEPEAQKSGKYEGYITQVAVEDDHHRFTITKKDGNMIMANFCIQKSDKELLEKAFLLQGYGAVVTVEYGPVDGFMPERCNPMLSIVDSTE